MIKIGDSVKFLNDVGGGVVTGFINKDMVNVENEDGFDIPYPVNKLINVNDPVLNKTRKGSVNLEEKEEMAPKQEAEPAAQEIEGKDSPDFYFCFVPSNAQNPLAGEIELFLVNDSNFTLLVHYAHFVHATYRTVMHGVVLPNTMMKLESIVQTDLNELPGYCFQVLYFREEDNMWHSPVSKKFNLNPVKFYKEKSFQSNLFFDRNAMIYQISKNEFETELSKLTDDDFRKVVKAKEQKINPIKVPEQKTEEIIEIDLHIHALFDDPAGLSNREMLDIQLEKVEREMRSAIQDRVKRVVFIHGVGQGVLKQEVARLLKSKFSKYAFQDASFKEYGYGATMVILRKK